MESIREILRAFFVYVMYPAVVIGLFIYLVSLLFFLVRCAKTMSGAIRRAVGGLLPIVILVFLVSSNFLDGGHLAEWLDRLSDTHRFVLGAVAAFVMMETGKQLGRTDANSAVAAYAFFVSCLLAVLLWVVMGGLLDKLNWTLFAFILVGGLHVMFRGLPGWFDSPSR
ncbi:hypothetical protein THTE_3387 [Thermogutta terrifontis]|uniref:Uncharacterized protein n=1 Tax=Thermogutta terrifontis TaxID=1331910 RepID=A0A286RJ45_9BACT|nr:hypothetical protein [Thermogutta terrifontis]ASV75989.1 hypothetical protein THTE_3387 [Thermogutta terrifontis]